MKVFIAGIMQGNRNDDKIHSQDYRRIISQKLSNLLQEEVGIIDPDKTDPERLSYNIDQAKDMFMRYCHVAGEVDMLISYLPEASMGSAVEMWMAYKAEIPIITISPLKSNWVVKLLSTHVYTDLDEFCEEFNTEVLNRIFK